MENGPDQHQSSPAHAGPQPNSKLEPGPDQHQSSPAHAGPQLNNKLEHHPDQHQRSLARGGPQLNEGDGLKYLPENVKEQFFWNSTQGRFRQDRRVWLLGVLNMRGQTWALSPLGHLLGHDPPAASGACPNSSSLRQGHSTASSS